MKSFRFTALLAAILACFSTSAVFGQWTQLNGPYSGPVGFVTIFNGNLYAGYTNFVGAKLYRSADAGQTWNEFNGAQPVLRITATAAASNDLFALTSNRDVLISVDGSSDWKIIDSGFVSRTSLSQLASMGDSVFAFTSNLSTYVFDANIERWAQQDTGLSGLQTLNAVVGQHGVLVAATTGKGIMRSTDAGVTWTQSNTGLGRISGGGLLKHADMLIFSPLSGSVADTLYASTDDGSSWSLLGVVPMRVSTQLVSDGSHLFAYSNTVGIWRSDDSAKTWSLHNDGLASLGVLSISVGNGMLAVGTSAGLFLSSDFGNRFYQKQIPAPGFFVPILSLAFNNGVLFAGTQQSGIYRSFDRGLSWSAADVGFNGPGIGALLSANGKIYCGEGNVYASTNNGDNWKRTDTLSIGMPRAVSALVLSGSKLYAASNNQGVFHSTDDGVTWVADTVGITRRTFTCFEATGDTLFVGTTTGLMRTLDGGTTWMPSNTGMTDSSIQAIVNFKGTRIVGTPNGVFRSDDGGQTWSSSLQFTSIRCLAVVFDSIFAGGDGVYYSTDGGVTWNLDGNDATSYTTYSFASDVRFLYGGSSGTGVYRREIGPNAIVFPNAQSSGIALRSVRPNPSIANATIEFDLSEASTIRLVAYDDRGVEVFMRDLGMLNAGANHVEIASLLVHTGVYRIELSGSIGRCSARVVVLK